MPLHPKYAQCDALAAELREAAAHVAAGQARFLDALARFHALDGGRVYGCKSTAHFLCWQCGIDLRAAAEMVRTATALEAAPRLKEAFSRGELSYSQVRLITRVVTPETEETLIMWARHGTASHLERIVRGYLRCRRAAAPDVHEARWRQRYLRTDWEWDGSFAIEGRLPPECGAVVERALQAAVDALGPPPKQGRGQEAGADGARPPGGDAGRSPGPDALPSPGPDALPSPGSDAAQPSAAEAADPPGARLADALVLVAEAALSCGMAPSATADRYQVVVCVDPQTLGGGEGLCELSNGVPLAPEVGRRIACDAGFLPVLQDRDGSVLDVGRKTRTIPPALRRALQLRYPTCAFPSCTQSRWLDAHHLTPWSEGGETSLANLTLLCRRHHVAHHRGEFTVRRAPDGTLVFYRPDGARIEKVPASCEPGALERANAVRGLVIDDETAMSRWDGRPGDLGVAVGGLLHLNRNRPPEPPLPPRKPPERRRVGWRLGPPRASPPPSGGAAWVARSQPDARDGAAPDARGGAACGPAFAPLPLPDASCAEASLDDAWLEDSRPP